MALLAPEDAELCKAFAEIAFSNPFLPTSAPTVQAMLGFRSVITVAPGRTTEEEARLRQVLLRLNGCLEGMRKRVAAGAEPRADELQVYEDLCVFVLFCQFQDALFDFHLACAEHAAEPRRSPPKVPFYDEFEHATRRLIGPFGARLSYLTDIPRVFAALYQFRRAVHHVTSYIVGESRPVYDLRVRVWQSIFTHDMRRYGRVLVDRMGDITLLVTGPSGTGKELVARAVGLSRYIPFDPQSQCFRENPRGSFHPLNLSAMTPTLIEAELFGYRRGAFTGAYADRAGWLETCSPCGTIFLDEIGDLDLAIQVKLLRVLQERAFQSLGDTHTKVFKGKVIAATNHDLLADIETGRFRSDLYYRLCSDVIRTPSLHEQLSDLPEELHRLTLHVCRRMVGEEEAPSLAAEAVAWMEGHLPAGYDWPGNFRELEQCVRNVLVRGEYAPPRKPGDTALQRLLDSFSRGELSAEELLRGYCTLQYARTGTYLETARRLGIDRRTVRARLDPELLARLRAEGIGASEPGVGEEEGDGDGRA